MKSGSVVDFGPKVTHEPFFRVISLKNWAKLGSEGSNFDFLEKRVLGRSAEQELFRICLKAPKRPKFRKRLARVKIISLRPRIRNPHYRVCPRDVPYNAGFLYEHVEK